MHSSMRQRRGPVLVATIVTLAIGLVPALARAAAPERDCGLHIPIAGGEAIIDPVTLAVVARTDSGGVVQLSAPAGGPLGQPSRPVHNRESAQWSYPQSGLTATASTTHGRLEVTIRATGDGSLTWPVTGTDRDSSSVQFPLGEGMTIPLADPFWNSPAAGLIDTKWDLIGSLRMPFWGYTVGNRGVSYTVPTDIGTTLAFRSNGTRLHTETTHTFSQREHTGTYVVDFALTDSSPIAAARDYRDWLTEHGGLTTLAQKAARNPDVTKLAGAFHAYLWGAARQPNAIAELRADGVGRMLLSWDASDSPPPAATVAAAEQAGYLAGPYDTWANAQEPETADSPTSIWPDGIWTDGCIVQADGRIKEGFGGRGCYLSSQAMAQREPMQHNLQHRVDAMTATRPNAYFLDVDSAGELFSDYSTVHPMTQTQDLHNRLARMKWLVDSHKLVLGGETAGSWANSVVSYSHGSSTPNVNGIWPFERDRATFGRYAPATAPGFFFKRVTLPADLSRQMFDPRYRVPLFETVLHNSIVSADRWELSYYKFPDLQTTRFLLAMVNNTPLNLVLDASTIQAKGAEIAALQQYFQPLHTAAFNTVLTDFRWLTPDHLVQRSQFGHGVLSVTANFSDRMFGTLPPGCADAQLRTDRHPRRICPAQLG